MHLYTKMAWSWFYFFPFTTWKKKKNKYNFLLCSSSTDGTGSMKTNILLLQSSISFRKNLAVWRGHWKHWHGISCGKQWRWAGDRVKCKQRASGSLLQTQSPVGLGRKLRTVGTKNHWGSCFCRWRSFILHAWAWVFSPFQGRWCLLCMSSTTKCWGLLLWMLMYLFPGWVKIPSMGFS